MQTLIFYTSTKSVKVTEGRTSDSTILYEFDEVPTVRVAPEGYYEVVQSVEGGENRVPVARFPIANTNMRIIK
jgi:hypothetical protein